MSWRTGMYVHPAYARTSIWHRIWLRLCPFIVEGHESGQRGFFIRSRAYDFFYKTSFEIGMTRPVNILQKRIGEKVSML